MSHIFDAWIPLGSTMATLDLLLFFMLIFSRYLCLSIMLPWLGAQLLPSQVRIGLCFILSLVSVVFLSPHTKIPDELNIFVITALFFKEALLGLLIGFLASLIFYTYELFGEIIDLARAASMAKLLVLHLRHQASLMGSFLFQFSLMIFIGLGLHREIIKTLFLSFEFFPVFSKPTFDENHFFYIATTILARIFSVSFNLSLPIVFICFLIDLSFGFLNRVAPQINAYFLSLPAKIIIGLFILWLALALLADDFLNTYQGLNSLMLHH